MGVRDLQKLLQIYIHCRSLCLYVWTPPKEPSPVGEGVVSPRTVK